MNDEKRINNGGEAFPRTQWTGSSKNYGYRDVPGMSLRDYFAAKAMAAIIIGNNAGEGTTGKFGCKGLVQDAYKISDAMIEESNK